MGLLKDFKDFAMKGNVLDLAIAVIIGAAFGKIISALVDNILMPIDRSFAGRRQQIQHPRRGWFQSRPLYSGCYRFSHHRLRFVPAGESTARQKESGSPASAYCY